MTEIRVPKLNNNDSAYLLVEWAAADGQAVRAGDPVAVLETSKAAEELTAEQDGVLRHLLPAGAECEPGQVIARLGGDGLAAAPQEGREGSGNAPDGQVGADHAEGGGERDGEGPDGQDPVVTAPARRFMDEHGISMEQVRALGRTVIRRAELESLLPAPVTESTDSAPESGAEGLIELSRGQRRVAEVVIRSHREIPAAFTVMRVDVTETLAFARRETKRLRALIGVPEVLVKATGELLGRFPLFFAAPVDERRARPAVTADVGVTMDVGRGMVVPVVRDAGGRPLAEIARDLMRLRRAAMEGSLREEDLRGGSIMLTLHTEEAVTMAVPIVFPGQVCALSLTAPRPEVVETADGFTTRKVVSLGLCYDHRFVNGREAGEFLGALRAALERPEPVPAAASATTSTPAPAPAVAVATPAGVAPAASAAGERREAVDLP
ncbi:2-oxo acid dehydrogenase subunit E2 [Planobispora takensis]|uniref:Dihydrolipoamide acetyltransferase component of pyruvate dehydrogenase complex n=1 Tax=Planobispora takensis TaxID=1367882 RepID=A0A8J3SZW8_9ACTN|nr:2-oxo acid dehydrogenase subunit E2 [Planobispora takensis]GII01425.1 dihydrolipoamide acetyltransferase component of pyruvate dehydrogenase complex [Planobispora takensis]